MNSFFKYVLATITGSILLMVLFFLVFFSMALNAGKKGDVKIKEHTVLHMKMDYMIKDKPSESPFDAFAATLTGELVKPMSLFDIIQSIKAAKEDERIDGIFLDLSVVGAGYGKLSEIREALEDFKASGKFIHAYSEVYYNQNYYFASVANNVHMNPSGTILFNGMAADITFMKETLKKMGIEMQAIKRGKFKGAIEPFVLDGLSDENRLQIQTYLNSIYDNYLGAVAASRSMSVDDLKLIANEVSVKTPNEALEHKLIDALSYRDQVMDAIQESLGDSEKDPEFITLSKYNAQRKRDNVDVVKTDGFIAVVYAEGGIVDGKGEPDEVGSKRFAKALQQVREDSTIKAVVLRVNSPGGSALASDIIWRETQLLKKEKPLIVSMGDVAASGGYYIACGADKIMALPNTITGSIGVFALFPNAEGLYDKMGLKTEVVKTSETADFGRLDRALNDKEYSILDAMIGQTYEQFLTRVSTGRTMERSHLDTIAEGRVWTGTYAKNIGLIDEFGGLDDAIEAAAEAAEMKSYKLTSYPKASSDFEEFFQAFSMTSMKSKLIKNELGTYYPIYEKLKKLEGMHGVQAIMPYDVTIR